MHFICCETSGEKGFPINNTIQMCIPSKRIVLIWQSTFALVNRLISDCAKWSSKRLSTVIISSVIIHDRSTNCKLGMPLSRRVCINGITLASVNSFSIHQSFHHSLPLTSIFFTHGKSFSAMN